MSTHNVCFCGKMKKTKYLPDTYSYVDLCPQYSNRFDFLGQTSHASSSVYSPVWVVAQTRLFAQSGY